MHYRITLSLYPITTETERYLLKTLEDYDKYIAPVAASYLSKFPNLRSPSFDELKVFIPESSRSFILEMFKYKMRSIKKGEKYFLEKEPGEDMELLKKTIPYHYSPFYRESRFGKITSETKSNALLWFISAFEDVRESENISPLMFDKINDTASDDWDKYTGTTPQSKRTNTVVEWIEGGRDFTNPDVLSFVSKEPLSPWFEELLRGFNREPAMVERILKRSRSPKDVKKTAIGVVMNMIGSKNKAVKKRGNDIAMEILEKAEYGLWSDLATAGTGKASREAIYQLANPPSPTVLPSDTMVDRIEAFDEIAAKNKKSHSKIVVQAYDNWNRFSSRDCSILKKISMKKGRKGKPNKTSGRAKYLFKEKCPEKYLETVPVMIKGEGEPAVENVLSELLYLHPYATEKRTEVKALMDRITAEGSHDEKMGLINAIDSTETIVDVCDAIETLSNDEDPMIAGAVEKTGIGKKRGC